MSYLSKRLFRRSTIILLTILLILPTFLTGLSAGAIAATEPIYTSSGSETASFGPEKAFDGKYDRYTNKDSRWASTLGLASKENPKWLQVEYPEVKTFQGFKIHWERKNVNAYSIQVSNDGTSFKTVYNSTANKNQWIETIKLANAETAKIVRLVITDFVSNSPNIEKDVDWATVSVFEFEVLESLIPVVVGTDNVAVGKTATASNTEAGSTFVPGNTVDGNMNTRWSTDRGDNVARTLTIDLNALTQVQSVIINWERTNIIAFNLTYSEDGTQYLPFYRQTQKFDNQRQQLTVPSPVNARYLKLEITQYDGGTINWPNIGINEVEVFSIHKNEIPGEITSLEQITSLPVNDETGKLNLPQATNGEIAIVGSNALPVIDLEGNVFRPLTDKNVKVTLKLTKTNKSTESKEFTVSVAGAHEDEGENEKPIVIPALQEWYGLEGFKVVDASTAIVVQEPAFQKAAKLFQQDLIDMEGLHLSIESKDTNAIIFKKDAEGVYGEEGYGIEIQNGNIVVTAEEYTGAFYATRTLLQLLKLNDGNLIPNGLVRDYPKFKIRGFMLDVGRKFTDLDYLYEYVKNMSYYKLNDFQVHLNDNELEMHLFNSIDDAIDNAYAGFRLESNIVGENGVPLTSQDGYYTKQEFNRFITDAGDYGIDIVPEFDTPGHALSMVKVRPDLYYKGQIVNGKPPEEAAAMLDLSHPDTLPFIKSIYNEYLDGDSPVFKDAPIHIGSDEYYGGAEAYRAYVDNMLKFVRDEKQRTVRLWGSLSNKTGTTPVTSKDVQLQVWNTGWANPQQMLNQGFDIINIDDGQVYMVPRAGYYRDRLNSQTIYNSYQPNKFSNGTVVNESNPQFLGGMFALWNDKVGKLENGITPYDMFDRVFDAIPAIAQKNWGSDTSGVTFAEFNETAKKTGFAPTTNPKFDVATVDSTVIDYNFTKGLQDNSGNGYDVEEKVNADVVAGKGLQLNDSESYVTTGLENLGPNAVMNVTLTLKDTNGPQILAEESYAGPNKTYATIYALNKDGYVGYDYAGRSYSFDYKLTAGKKTTLTFVTELEKTRLFVNGEEIPLTADTRMPYNTLVLPLERIGSATNSVNGVISTLTIVKGKYIDPTRIDPGTMNISATSEETVQGDTKVEGPIGLAFDGNTGTIWHSKWSKNPPLPYEVNMELAEETTLSKFVYTPRQAGGQNGNILNYRVQVSTDGQNYSDVTAGSWGNDANIKTIDLIGVSAKYVRFIVENGMGGFASAAEFSLHKKVEEQLVEPILIVKDATIIAGDELDLTSLITEAKDSRGNDATASVEIDEGNFDATKPGTYMITFTLKAEGYEDIVKTATVTVKEKATDPEKLKKPVLAVKNATISPGDKLDLVSLIVVAKDSERKDATSSVVIDKGDFDANTPGKYTITFTLTVGGFGDYVKTASVKVKAK
ncbi:discoidin domain-containing protein [Neobacillus sp. FSL H8-0543]|uniref:discoidin domain-containing protein n=1 Tax=Neobacillus sp. FSL H8-0543 TaxID=2954672 RepID=UPI0031588AC3